MANKKNCPENTDIAILKDNVKDLKSKHEVLTQHEVRVSLAEQAIKVSTETQTLILKNTEEIKKQQQETTEALGLVQQSNKNQWREISGLREGLDEHKKEVCDTVQSHKKWTESKLNKFIVFFISLTSAIAVIMTVGIMVVK
jgi:hypothetical protein